MATATTSTQQVQLQQVMPVQQTPQQQQQKAPIAKPRDPFWLGGKETGVPLEKKEILYLTHIETTTQGWLFFFLLVGLPPTFPNLD